MLNFRSANRTGRTLILAVTFIGWVLLSNHCALGRLAPGEQARKGHGCCQSGAAKPTENPAGGKRGMECCKSLHVVRPEIVKAADLAPPGTAMAILAAVLTIELQAEDPTLRAVATGPPRAASFSELVLHRSLRSHAPPILA